MSMGNYSASPTATRRIRFFSIGMWVVAAFAVVVITGASATYGNLGEFDRVYPWEDPNVATAVSEGGDEWSGDGASVIRLQSGEKGYTAELLSGDDLSLYYGSYEPDGEAWPEFAGGIYGDHTLTLVTPAGETDVWVRAEGPWRLRLTPIDAIPIEDSHSGKGNAFLSYTGTARSAKVTYVGEGIFFLSTYTSAGQDSPIIESESVTDRVIWEGDGTVFFDIESDADRGAWTIDIEELAEPTATPTGTPSSTATPNAGG